MINLNVLVSYDLNNNHVLILFMKNAKATSPRWQVDNEAIGLSRGQPLFMYLVPTLIMSKTMLPFKRIHTASIINPIITNPIIINPIIINPIITNPIIINPIIRQFVPIIVLCENEYFLITNLHGSFINATSSPLVL